MNLLIIADDSDLEEAFADHVDEVTTASIASVRIDTEGGRVKVGDEEIGEYDAIYLDPNPKIAIFSRVFLESLLNRDIATNIDPTAFFILAKKSYLYQVLAERNIPLPPTAAISTEKGITGLADRYDFPLVGKKFEWFVRRDMSLLEDTDQLQSFVEHLDHGSHVLVLQEQVDGDVYDCLYIDGEVISIKLEDEGWRKRSRDATQSYHSVSSGLQDIVTDAARSIGADICRVRLVGDQVVDAQLDPDLARFQRVSGKNVYGSVVSVLEEE